MATKDDIEVIGYITISICHVDILGISELKWVNLTQMTVISATVGKNPLEEMEYPS